MEARQTKTERPDYDEIWAILRETDRIVKETAQESARRQKEIDRQMKETEKIIGDLGRRFGETVEYMVAPNLVKKFKKLGFVFEKVYQNTEITDEKNNIYLEVDATLENGVKVMLVEVKTKPTIPDVKDHIERLNKMRVYADLHGDTRAFLGAVAGVVVQANVKEYALGEGLYVLEPSGETFIITPPKGLPKEW